MDKKSLYLSTNISDLQKLAEIRPVDTKSVKNACTLLNKLYEKHEKAFLDCDEELAYVYAMRFLECLSQARQLFKNDIKYISAIISSSKMQTACNRAEILKSGLKNRYDLCQASVKDVEQKSVVVDGPVEYANDTVDGSLTCKKMYNKLKGGSEKILIVDTRPRAEYSKCRIKYSGAVNIPSEALFKGCSIDDVNELFKRECDDEKWIIWKERSTATSIVMLDWDMSVLDGVNMVRDAIYKWVSEKTIKKPVLLVGGLKSFLLHYPTMVTDPQYKGPPDDTTTTSVNPVNIKYPNWDEMEKEKKIKLAEEQRIKMLKDATSDISLEERFNNLRAERAPIKSQNDILSLVVDRSLKPDLMSSKQINEEDNLIPLDNINEAPTMVIDRKLKPDLMSSKQIIDVDNLIPLDTTSEAPTMVIDRKLKPDVPKKVKTNQNDIEQKSTENQRQSRRLSSNSRTDQDRNNFTAKGGAKSIPPPSDSENVKLPSWVSREFDQHTNEYFYFDHKKNTRYTTLPEEYVESRKETTRTHVDCVEPLKDHSLHMSKEPSSATTTPSSAMKRSTSQPNLTDESIVLPKPDTIDLSSSHGSRAPPKLDRLTKPIHNKVFDDFSAGRLNSFNPTYRNVTPGLTGLRNMGNTCYMNSVIQALSNTQFLSNYILTGCYQQHVNRVNPLGYHGELINEFALLTKALWKGLYKEISPADFKKMVDSKNEMFRGCEQHDSQEFLLFLLDGLHEDLNRGTRHHPVKAEAAVSGEQNACSDVERAQNSWKAHVAVNDSVVVKMFQGQYRSKVTCDHCMMSSVTFDAFMYLSLPLVTSHSRCTLDDCIKLFLAEEKMTGPSQWFCPKCKTNRNARKKIDIWKLPPYLLIHLKRFSCSGQYRQKLNTFVDFPMETLSLSGILSHTMQPHKHQDYHLYAVSNHHGNMESGHYTSYCKNSKEGEWYNYDDDTVTRIKQSEARTPSAYILFYESYNIKQASMKNQG